MIKKIMALSLGLLTFSALTNDVQAARDTYRKHLNNKSMSDDFDEPSNFEYSPSAKSNKKFTGKNFRKATPSQQRRNAAAPQQRRNISASEQTRNASMHSQGNRNTSRMMVKSRAHQEQYGDEGYEDETNNLPHTKKGDRVKSIVDGVGTTIDKVGKTFMPLANTYMSHRLDQDLWKQEQEARRQEQEARRQEREWELKQKKEERKRKEKLQEKQEERRRLMEEKRRQEEEERRKKEQEERDPRKLREMKKRQLEEKKSECELDFEDQLTARNLGDADRADRLIENIEKEGCSVILEQVEDAACNLLLRGRMEGIPKSLGGARCVKQWEKENGAKMKFDRKEGMYFVPSDDEFEEEVEVKQRSIAEPKPESRVETPAPAPAPVQQRTCPGPFGPRPC